MNDDNMKTLMKSTAIAFSRYPDKVWQAAIPQTWSVEAQPRSGGKATLVIDLLLERAAPGETPHIGHAAYEIDIQQHQRIDIAVTVSHNRITASVDGIPHSPHAVFWPRSEIHGMVRWQVSWQEACAETPDLMWRSQAINARPDMDEVTFLDEAWLDHDRRRPERDNLARVILEHLALAIKELATTLPPGGRVLDFGCGNQPYYPYFHGQCGQYLGIDTSPGPMVDMVYADTVPLPDASFDLVLCTQVLEHSRSPQRVADEIRRLLVPGGRALVSAPFCWHYHPWPNDYWRFTREGMSILFENFAECRIESDCGSIRTLTEEFGFLLERQGKGGKPVRLLLDQLSEYLEASLPDTLLPAHHIAWIVR